MVTAGPNRTRPGVGLTRSRMWQRCRWRRPIASTRSAVARPSIECTPAPYAGRRRLEGPPALSDRRRNTLCGGGESGIPLAHRTGVAEGRVSELEPCDMRIKAGADVLPVEHVLTELRVPAPRGGAQVRVRKAIGRR